MRTTRPRSTRSKASCPAFASCSWSAARETAGAPTRRSWRPPRATTGRWTRGRATPASSTSPPAPWATRRWCSTRTRRIRSATRSRAGSGPPENDPPRLQLPPLGVEPGLVGKPSPTLTRSVNDDGGQPLPYDSEGDIAVRVEPERPVGLFKEYWRNPEATRNSMRGDWYVTGDRAYVDGDGYFWFVGRADDVIISAGYRIGPFEVESALVEHAAVAEAAVVGKGDPTRGTIVKAYVILAPGHDASDALAVELQEHCKKVTAPYKYPREIEFVTELPKTISGKIRRVELRAR